MKKFMVSGWVIPMLILAFSVVPLRYAQGAVLTLSDGINNVIVNDGGVGDLDARSGVIMYSGAVGIWNTNISTGFSKPYFPSDVPHMDLSSANFSTRSSSATTLTVTLSDTDFATGSNWSGFKSLIGGVTSGTVDFTTAFADPDNHVLANMAFGTGAFSGSANFTGVPAGPFSLIEIVKITHAAGGMPYASKTTSFNAEVFATPEPWALFTFASGLIGLIGYRRMRRMQ